MFSDSAHLVSRNTSECFQTVVTEAGPWNAHAAQVVDMTCIEKQSFHVSRT